MTTYAVMVVLIYLYNCFNRLIRLENVTEVSMSAYGLLP